MATNAEKLTQRIKLQELRSTALKNVAAEGVTGALASLSRSCLAFKMDVLDSEWEKFNALHTLLFEGKYPGLLESSYVKDDVYNQSFTHYNSAKLALLKRKEELETARDAPTGASMLETSFAQVGSSLFQKLPEVPLPTFSGNYLEWKHFQEMFVSLVGTNDVVTPVVKMHYLRTSLKGEAADIVANLPITGDAFATAWDLLVTRYNNPRLLLSAHLDCLLARSKIASRSAKELDELLRSCTKALDGIKALKISTESWDPILVHLTVSRLDDRLRESWENKLGSSTEIPSFAELTKFLTGRARAMETFEVSQGASSSAPQTSASSSLATRSAPSRSSASVNVSSAAEGSSAPGLCAICSERHFVLFCPLYRAKSVTERIEAVKQHRLCFNCLGRHRIADCRTGQACQKCGERHHTSTHVDRPQRFEASTSAQPVATSRSDTLADELLADDTLADTQLAKDTFAIDASAFATGASALAAGFVSKPTVLLATCKVLVFAPRVQPLTARVLIDPGAEVSFITEKFSKKLKVLRQPSTVSLCGIGNTSAGNTRGSCALEIQSLHSNERIQLQAYILPILTAHLPSFAVEVPHWPHLEGLQLADPDFLTPGPVDMILGAAPTGLIINSEVIKGPKDTPVAQSTMFGWIIFGSANSLCNNATAYGHHLSADQDLYNLLSKFWSQEEPPTTIVQSLSDQECENHFIRTHSRDSSGRYIVRLPLISSATQLGDSLNTARRCLQSTLKRLVANPSFSTLYNNFMNEYEQLNHMKLAPSSATDLQPIYYLPHHGVLKEQSTTTKLRVVFNGSSNTNSGVSLNDLLHTGPKIQIDLSDVLLWVRRHRFVFATDITKMFRQINVHPLDWDLQRILWVDQHSNIVPYQLTTVTYGTRCAPYLAVRTLLQLAKDEGHRFPLAVEPLTKGRYVDDIYGGADSLQEAELIAHQLTSMCSAGGFPLAKWASNSSDLLRKVSPIDQTTTDPITFEDSTINVLGLTWHPSTDQFKFTYSLSAESTITKRSILSETARLFDPLGFLAPLVIRAKILLQELWLEKLGWDEPLTPALAHKWHLFRQDLQHIESLEIPRWLHLSASTTVEIHGFADASQLAMAAVVFLRVTTPDGNSTILLVCAKTQVAPLKHLTIPRLELNAAVILAQLTHYVQKTLELGDAPILLWTDSSVALTWIRSHPSRWKEYVCNRILKIQELLPAAKWQFISGKQNPADCASRGLSALKLKQHPLWWQGPPWLSLPREEWPRFDPPAQTTSHLEEKPGLIFNVATEADHPLWELVMRYSSLPRLLRTTAICLRFISCLKKVPHSSLTTSLTTADLESARVLISKIIQQSYFAEELKTLSKDNQLAKSNHMTKLTPFIDHQGVLRVGGRLKHSLLDPEQKHPTILPRDSPFTSLLIADAHHRTLHGGTQLTLAYLRRSYWIIGGRAPVRSFILRCTTCTRHRGLRAQQLMGQLPAARVTPSRAFLHTGVDYAGPITLKTWKGRGAKTHKGWIAVFVCFSTSAVHLEVVTDYSTDAFIAAYRRFASRRGICHTLYSDCGTNFAGADATLKNLFKSGSKELGQLATLFSNDGTTWVFNPPGAPHFGGKWEAAVKSLKFHLQRVIGETLLTYEEMTTFLNQVEAVLNSRPLAPLSEDPADLAVLTPGHFLIGEPLTAVPSHSLSEIAETRLSKWQLIQQRTEHFWNRWSAECIHRFQSISKWHHPTNEIKVGSMVLLTDERLPPTKWPLARVLSLHPGKDGLTRVVTIKTSTSTLTRPIAKLCVLPIYPLQEPVVNAVANGGENVEKSAS